MPRRRTFRLVPILLLLFTVFTVTEIWLIFQMAQLISWPLTILVAISTGIIGSIMIKRQGMAVMQQGLQQARGGQFPGQPIAEGAIIIVGGAFLITPGLITDLIGLSTLVPPIRKLYARLLVRFVMKNFTMQAMGAGTTSQGGFFYSSTFGSAPGGSPQPPFQPPIETTPQHTPPGKRSFSEDDVIDVEFKRRD